MRGYRALASMRRNGLLHGRDHRGIVGLAEDGGTGNEGVGTGARNLGDVVDLHATVDFQANIATAAVDHPAHPPQLVQRRGNELLAAKTRVDRHDQHQIELIALLLFFEFINLLLHPFLDRITNHSPILMLLAMAAIAGLLIPLHHRMEKLITNMLVSKNNRVRLEAARRTIEELEGRPNETNAN